MNMINGSNRTSASVPIEPAVMNFDKNSKVEVLGNQTAPIEKKHAEVQHSGKEKDIDPKTIAQSVDTANKLVLIFDKSIKFVYNPEIGVNFIDIVDNNTDEVIKKIPSDDIRRFLEAVKGAVGMIIDEKA